MTIIDDILQFKEQLFKSETRYLYESLLLANLATYQLNLPKNKTKEDFEDMTISEIMFKIDEEFIELQLELGTNEPFYQTDKINLERAISELGDLTACCVGLLAHIIKHKDKK